MPAACQSWILVPFPESEPDLAPAARMRTRSLAPHGPGTRRDDVEAPPRVFVSTVAPRQ